MRNGQDIGCLRGNHSLAAIVALVRRIAGHGTAALHALLIMGHGGQAVRELKAEQSDHGQKHELSFAHNPKLTLGGLDARVNERIHRWRSRILATTLPGQADVRTQGRMGALRTNQFCGYGGNPRHDGTLGPTWVQFKSEISGRFSCKQYRTQHLEFSSIFFGTRRSASRIAGLPFTQNFRPAQRCGTHNRP
jgi:hypothetical protein